MKRVQAVLTCVIAGAVCTAAYTAATAGAQPLAAGAHSSRAVTIELRHTSLGRILVTSSGFTLYEFSRDHGAKDSCASISGCLATWPALKTSGRPTAGSGVSSSLLSTVKISGGAEQVTYAGHPLYLYSGDSGPGETSYVGVKQFGGTWDALSSSGGAVR